MRKEDAAKPLDLYRRVSTRVPSLTLFLQVNGRGNEIYNFNIEIFTGKLPYRKMVVILIVRV
jgi:hypothetical protein